MPGLSWYSKKVADEYPWTPTAFIPTIPLQMMPKIPLNTSYLRPPERISNVQELCTIYSIYTVYST